MQISSSTPFLASNIYHFDIENKKVLDHADELGEKYTIKTLESGLKVGIIGVIVFIAPYFAILVYGIFICLRHFKQLCNFENICVLFGIALTLATGFYCGNTIDNPFANILLSFICAYSVIFIRPDISKSEIK